MPNFIGGQDDWLISYYEIVSEIERNNNSDHPCPEIKRIRKYEGRGGMWNLAKDLTNKFQEEYHEGRDDCVFFDLLEDFMNKHLFDLPAKDPIGVCNRTKTYVYDTTTEGYSAYCPELDEDLYDFEWKPL